MNEERIERLRGKLRRQMLSANKQAARIEADPTNEKVDYWRRLYTGHVLTIERLQSEIEQLKKGDLSEAARAGGVEIHVPLGRFNVAPEKVEIESDPFIPSEEKI